MKFLSFQLRGKEHLINTDHVLKITETEEGTAALHMTDGHVWETNNTYDVVRAGLLSMSNSSFQVSKRTHEQITRDVKSKLGESNA